MASGCGLESGWEGTQPGPLVDEFGELPVLVGECPPGEWQGAPGRMP